MSRDHLLFFDIYANSLFLKIHKFSEVGENKDVTAQVWMDLPIGLSTVTWLILHIGFLY